MSTTSNSSSSRDFAEQLSIHKLLLRHASQNSLDESSQKESTQSSPERPFYHNSEHFSKAFSKFNMMRKEKFLCDVVLITTNKEEFPAHKAVLASCSPYFHAMFSCFEESNQNRIVLQDVDPKALSLLLDYVYSSEIQVNEDNVQTLLPAANLLQMFDVKEACSEFLVTQLHPSNCLGIRAFADLHGCIDLLNLADKYTAQHFSDVVDGEEFSSLQCQDVIRIISSDKLTVSSEEKVYEAVMNWVNANIDDRNIELSHLMEYVRLPLLPQDYLLQHVETNTLMRSNAHCKDLLIEALKYHLLKADQKQIYQTSRTRPRLPIGMPKCYDFETQKWNPLAEMPTRRCRAGLASVCGRIYAIGGFNGSLRVRTVDLYEPNLDQWFPAPDMETRRSTLGVAVLNNCIYAVGGFDGSTGLKSAEKFDPATQEWRAVASMTTRRSSVGVGVLNGLLYAVGGYDGASRHCLASVECYSPETDSWSLIGEMACRRSGAGVGVLNGYLYAIGGHDGPMVRRSVERFDTVTKTWTSIADMSLCRRNAGVVTHDGLLYVVGGDDGTTNLNSVEVYDPATNSWSMLSACMGIGRSYAGIAIINRPC
ncbi:RING canal kelch protein [Daphnia magna]|uniref:Kelch-like protein diablo n=1 Tax=Daphnia magna TaxID=35525 RepID=A0A164Y879_9CRUS|nr:RING canal kelch protein [Daphnia magna]